MATLQEGLRCDWRTTPTGELKAERAEAADALDAAEKLIAKLDECDGPLTGVVAFYEAHGCQYTGSTYGEELEALRSLLRKGKEK